MDLDIDTNNNFYVSGYAGGYDPSTTIDLDPGTGIDTRTLLGLGDSMFVKFDSDGNYLWGRTFGTSAYDFAVGVTLDGNNYLYVFGAFDGTPDFDTGGGTNNIASNGLTDLFLSKYDSSGNYIFTKTFGGASDESTNWPNHIKIDGSSMYLSLMVGGNIVLNPDGGTATTNYSGSVDMTLAKFDIDNTPPADFTLVSPKDYITNTAPTLIFNKSSDANGISSYSVFLDTEKNKNYSISGIPSSGNGTANYIWKDDTDQKVEFANEEDLDSGNDQIKVYFKALVQNPLFEGAHLWKVIATDGQSNQKTMTIDFALDETNPNVSGLSLAGVGKITGGKTYKLGLRNRTLSFSGKVSDLYIGTTKTNSNGTVDTFDKVSSGPDSVKLVIKKLKQPNVYQDYLTKTYTLDGIINVTNVEKYKNLNILSPLSLKDGYYQVSLEFSDKAGNIYKYPNFYLTTLAKTDVIEKETVGVKNEMSNINQSQSIVNFPTNSLFRRALSWLIGLFTIDRIP